MPPLKTLQVSLTACSLRLSDKLLMSLPPACPPLPLLLFPLLLSGFPPNIRWTCDKLKKLDLSRNRLRALPDTFDDLKRLSVINVSHNYLKELPQSCCWGCLNLVSKLGLRWLSCLWELDMAARPISELAIMVQWGANCSA